MAGSYTALSLCLLALSASVFPAFFLRLPETYMLLPLFLAGLCRGLSWQICGSSDGIQEWEFIRNAHSALNHAIGRVGFADTTTPLTQALIAGDKSGISPEVRNAFRISGASHILALSGLHLGLIYALVSRILSIGGGHPIIVRIRSLSIILFCGFYSVMTGATPSIMRAFLFILLRETALITGRCASPVTTFSTALMIHLTIAPGSILMPGFQLSYLAMCGIYLVFPRLSAIYPAAKYDPIKKIWDIATLSISCQLFTAPAAWFHFHSFPKWFLLTNMIAMPISTLLMFAAITSLALSAIHCCPLPIIKATDVLASALTSALGIISSF